MKIEECELYMIIGDEKPIFVDKDGNWWYGGGKGINVAVFNNRKDAQRFARKVMNSKLDAVPIWTKVVRLSSVFFEVSQ